MEKNKTLKVGQSLQNKFYGVTICHNEVLRVTDVGQALPPQFYSLSALVSVDLHNVLRIRNICSVKESIE